VGDTLRFAAASAAGDRHPNEDAWAADERRGAFAVCDGVTSTFLADGTYPGWAGGGRAAWLAAAALAAAPPGPPREALGHALAAADRLIHALNRHRDDGAIDYLEHDVYNATAVAAIVQPRAATIACLGDAAALLQPRAGPARLLTRFDTAAAEKLRDGELRDMPLAERVVLFRRELRNRAEPWRGRPSMGFGVLDGTGRYAAMAQWVEQPLAPGDRLYLVSDSTGHYLVDLIARGERLPDTPAQTIAGAAAWEGAAYRDDLTALVVDVLSP
jgi:serine/threonine protein phosphatase PrpC